MASIRYRLAMPEPHTHLFHVTLRVEGTPGPVELVMPSWTPGSYLLREFPRRVQRFRAEDPATAAPLRWEKLDKNTWRVAAPVDGALTVRYEVYAHELTVRTSHLDTSHGYVNGASVFMAVRGRLDAPVGLEVDPPPGWTVTTALPRAGSGARFRAGDYHELVDSPLEIGTHTVLEFGVDGTPHRYAIWGRGDHDAERLIVDTRRIVRTAAGFWGTLPYPDYSFVLHLVPGGRGGLEHRNSCSLQADPSALFGSGYEQFLALVAHEFFHAWNGTRLRPEPLVSPDYTRENYTRNLWVVEGLTTYYTDLLLCRSGAITAERYLERLGDSIHRLQTLPGRHVQSLAEASFDAWIKFYRPDEHTPNSQVSYYHKGALVGFVLDMRIRRATSNRRSLDDVMRTLWQRYGARDAGYPEAMDAGIRAVAEEVCGEPLEEFFAAYVFGTEELPFDEALDAAGLEFAAAEAEPTPGSGLLGATMAPGRPANGTGAAADAAFRLGLRVEERDGRAVVAQVRSGSPAHRHGVNAGDELLAVAGWRVDARSLEAHLAAHLRAHPEAESGAEPLRITVARRSELLDLEVDPGTGDSPPARRPVVRRRDASPAQRAVLDGWLQPAAWPAGEGGAGAVDAGVSRW